MKNNGMVQLIDEISEKKEELGELFYQSISSATEPDASVVTKITMEIKRLEEQLQALKAQEKEETTGQLLCKNCGSKLDEDSRFCSHCGMSVEERTTMPSSPPPPPPIRSSQAMKSSKPPKKRLFKRPFFWVFIIIILYFIAAFLYNLKYILY